MNAKKRGMSGLELSFYFQVTECSVDGFLPGDGCLVQLPSSETYNPGGMDSLFCKSGKYATKAHLQLVHCWYEKKVQINSFSVQG